MGPEAAFGDRVVGLELHAHVVTLRGDDFGRLRATELAVQPGVRGQAAAHLHEVVLTHLQGGAMGSRPVPSSPAADPGAWQGCLPESCTLPGGQSSSVRPSGRVLSTLTGIPPAQGADRGHS